MSEWVLEVSEVNEYVRQLLQNEPALRKVRLRGEISNFKRHSSGHWYFTLKDERCRIAAVMFRQNAMRMSIRPMDGMSVIVSGQVGLYSEGGSYQITCDSMRPDGIGTLYQQFEALKNCLAAEGLFDEEHKRRLPYRPKKIAVVTSETGAVLHDICMVSRARDPGVPLVLVPVQVQGAGAAESIAQGIRRAAKIPEVEVVIVGRGGGSVEELWAFNEEKVARAVAASDIPVISAVGHETDFTICDFAADLRAPTPSAAAELAVSDRAEQHAYINQLGRRCISALDSYIRFGCNEIKRISAELSAYGPMQQIVAQRQTLDSLISDMQSAALRVQHRDKLNLSVLAGRLDALSPLRILSSGYAAVERGGKLISKTNVPEAGDDITVTSADLKLTARVTSAVRNGGTDNG